MSDTIEQRLAALEQRLHDLERQPERGHGDRDDHRSRRRDEDEGRGEQRGHRRGPRGVDRMASDGGPNERGRRPGGPRRGPDAGPGHESDHLREGPKGRECGPRGRHRGPEFGPRGWGFGGSHDRRGFRGGPDLERFRRRADRAAVSGFMQFRGYHHAQAGNLELEYIWGIPDISTDDVLAMDDNRNVKVLSALAHPARLRMMKAIIQQPGTAAELRERLDLTSTGQTYHALNMLQNGGMIEQQDDGTYTAVGDKASGFLILLGGLFNLTEGDYEPAFMDVDLDEPEPEDEGQPEHQAAPSSDQQHDEADTIPQADAE